MRRWLPLALAAFGVAGCHTDMWRQPVGEPLGENDFFPSGQMSRPLLPGTVARGHERQDTVFFTGQQNGRWVTELPMPVTKKLLLRGQERYNIYCSPCHGLVGDGNGMIALRGFKLKRPVGNYHTQRLKAMPVGHFYDVITNGYGTMYSYASRVEPPDRWAIVAYIRALQLSQDAPLGDADSAALAESLKPKSERTPGHDDHGEPHEGGHGADSALQGGRAEGDAHGEGTRATTEGGEVKIEGGH